MTAPSLAVGIVVLMLAAASGAWARTPPQVQVADPSAITTTGEATANVAPDLAFVQLSAEGRAKKTADAQKIAADAMTNLRTALKALPLAPNAVRTTGYTVSEEYDRVGGEQTFKDYFARNTIEVRVDDLKQLPAVIDTAGATGAATISSLRFDLKDRAGVERELLRRAVEDAMSRADAIAAGAHRTVGSIIKILEQRFAPSYPSAPPPPGFGGGRGGGAPTPIEPGDVQVRTSVTLTVAIR